MLEEEMWSHQKKKKKWILMHFRALSQIGLLTLPNPNSRLSKGWPKLSTKPILEETFSFQEVGTMTKPCAMWAEYLSYPESVDMFHVSTKASQTEVSPPNPPPTQIQTNPGHLTNAKTCNEAAAQLLYVRAQTLSASFHYFKKMKLNPYY